ncbi:hypothetical protein M1466_01600 [Candidatus Dependentiae bacterium]|nr:hypothetical protein [Candidatus Dependentiae bacterium]
MQNKVLELYDSRIISTMEHIYLKSKKGQESAESRDLFLISNIADEEGAVFVQIKENGYRNATLALTMKPIKGY